MEKVYQGKKILVVEDDGISQVVIQEILQLLGCKVEVVDSGEKAGKKLDLMDFDLIMMDVWLKEDDGIEVTKRIRERDDDNQSVPVIVLTASASSYQPELFRELQIVDHLCKPVDVEIVKNALAKVFKEESI